MNTKPKPDCKCKGGLPPPPPIPVVVAATPSEAVVASNGKPSGKALHRSYKGRKRGPKTKWGKIDPVKVAVLAGKLGASESQLAAALGVTTQTLRNWKRERKQLFCSLESAKAAKDNQVVHSLFERATGYKHKALKIMVVNGEVKKVPYTEQYAPDTGAAIFWLKNRDPERWKDRTDATIGNPDGTNLKGGTTVIAPTVVFVQPNKEVTPPTNIKEIGNNGDPDGGDA